MVHIINWRDGQPKIAHLSAVHWGGYRDRERADDPDERNRLERLKGFARHAVQGHKTSDHHKHENQEQVYYVLSGRGEVLFGEERFPVQDGDAIYLPSGIYHQMFNDMNQDWLEHHVISQKVEGNGGEFAIRNWRDVPAMGDGEGAVRWHQLGLEGEADVGLMRGLQFIDREAVQPRGRTIERRYEDFEQVYYVLENGGILAADGEEWEIQDGDMIHLPPGTQYSIRNPHAEWLSYMIMAA
jgi:mannose-6-phosphate isomerase-like protein (cupin superfamily)